MLRQIDSINNDLHEQKAFESQLADPSHFNQIAQDIFERHYLQPFSGAKKTNLYQLPVERISHGAQHAARVAAYLPILVNILREKNHALAIALTDIELRYLQIGALFHDAARKSDVDEDRWDEESEEICYAYFLKHSVSPDKAALFSKIISEKESVHKNPVINFYRELLQAADSLDIIRCKNAFYLKYIRLATIDNKEKLTQFAKEILLLIAKQFDLRDDCQIVVDKSVVAKGTKTRDKSRPELKQSYEHSTHIFQRTIDDFEQFPFIKQYFNQNKLREHIVLETNVPPLETATPPIIATKPKAAKRLKYYHAVFYRIKLEKKLDQYIARFKDINSATDFVTFIQAESSYIPLDTKLHWLERPEDVETPFAILFSGNLFNQLQTEYRRISPSTLLAYPFLIKSLRSDEFNYTRRFMADLLPLPNDTKAPPLRPSKKKLFTVTASGIFQRAVKPPMYSHEQKKGFSPIQSASLVTADLQPPVFGFGKRQKLLGVIIPRELALFNRMFIYDGGTYNRPCDHDSLKDAEEYFEKTVNAEKPILFADEEIFAKTLTLPEYSDSFNEVLTRISWKPDHRCMLFIATNTLETRLLAIACARTLKTRLISHEKSQGRELDRNYQIKIIYYVPRKFGQQQDPLHGTEYDVFAQLSDHMAAFDIYHDNKARNNCYDKHQYEFLLGLTPSTLVKALREMVGAQSLIERIYHANLTHIIESIFDIICTSTHLADELFVPFVMQRGIRDLFLKYIYNHHLNEWIELFFQTFKDNNDLNIGLQLAIKCGKIDHVTRLLKFQTYIWSNLTTEGSTLHAAIKSGHAEIIHLLLNDRQLYKKYLNPYQLNPLHIAAKYNSLSAIKTILAFGFDVNSQNNKGETALHIAAANNQLAVIEFLYSVGADLAIVNKKNEMAFDVAMNAMHTECGLFIINHASPSNQFRHINNKYGNNLNSCLHIAINQQNLKLLHFLLDNDVDVNAANLLGETPVHLAIFKNNLGMLKLLVDKKATLLPVMKSGFSALDIATSNHACPAMITFLCKQCPDLIPLCKNLPLHALIIAKKTKALQALLNFKIDVNATNDSKQTPLHTAISIQKIDIVNLLLANKADIHHVDKEGSNALFYAVLHNQESIANFLIARGVRFDIKLSDGTTLLHIAAYHACHSLFKTIVNLFKHANLLDVNAETKDGRTPLFCALENVEGSKYPNTLELLQHNANANTTWIKTHIMNSYRSKACNLVKLKLYIEERLLENKFTLPLLGNELFSFLHHSGFTWFKHNKENKIKAATALLTAILEGKSVSLKEYSGEYTNGRLGEICKALLASGIDVNAYLKDEVVEKPKI